jgi:hypothetical protein
MNNPRWKVDKNAYTKHFDERFSSMYTLLVGAQMCSDRDKPLYLLCENLQRHMRSWLAELHNIEWHAEEDEVDE